MKFRCWSTKNSEEAFGVDIEASDAEEAAKEYAESRWCDYDYPDELEVSVRYIYYLGTDIPRYEGGQTEIFVVTAEPMLVFYATKKKGGA